MLFALGAAVLDGPISQGAIHGLKVTAVAIGAHAVWAMALCRAHTETEVHELPMRVSIRAGHLASLTFAALLAGLPLLAWVSPSETLAVMDAFYRAGALVFGGGHVVLPLLEAEVVQSGWVGANEFLAGYGAAQAVPGPLLTFASYLGVTMTPPLKVVSFHRPRGRDNLA